MAEESQTNALHFLDYWRVVRDRKEVILAVALLTIVTGTAYTLMMPKKFTATTQLEVREDAMDVDPSGALLVKTDSGEIANITFGDCFLN